MKRRTFITGLAVTPILTSLPVITLLNTGVEKIPTEVVATINFEPRILFYAIFEKHPDGINIKVEKTPADNTEIVGTIYDRPDFYKWLVDDLDKLMPQKQVS